VGSACAEIDRFQFGDCKDPHGGIVLRCAGQSIGASKELQRELRFLPSARLRGGSTLTRYLFCRRAKRWNYPSYEMKGKSDYAASPLTDVGLSTLMNEVANGAGMYVICDSYGGAIADTAPDATAFAHRTGTLYCLQYGSTWTDPRETPTGLAKCEALIPRCGHTSPARHTSTIATSIWPIGKTRTGAKTLRD